MKIAINFEGLKREINGSFEICGSFEDLKILRDRLDEELGDHFCYGWIEIHERIKAIPNQKPIGWKE